jgi:hypothetical protein
MEVKQLVGWNSRRVRQERGLKSRHWRLRRMGAPHGSAKNSRMVWPPPFTQRKSVTVNLAV